MNDVLWYKGGNLVPRPPAQTLCEIKSGREALVRGYLKVARGSKILNVKVYYDTSEHSCSEHN